MTWIGTVVKFTVPAIAVYCVLEVGRSLSRGCVRFGSFIVSRRDSPAAFWSVLSFYVFVAVIGVMVAAELWIGLNLRFWL